MSFKHKAPAFALVATMALVPTWAFGMGGAGGAGGIGCSNLPEYDRAVGTLQGMSTCDMTIDEARRIVGAQQGRSAASDTGAPAPSHHRRHRTQPPQQ